MGITRNPEIMHGTGVLSAENTLARPFKTSQKTALRALFLRPERFFTPKKRQKTSKMPPAVDYRGIFDQKKYAVKEPDPETGLYYYGARYLDPKTSRWISGDPALGEYLPSAPLGEEEKRRNRSLPGQGGVFNYVNLHVYHYAGNNPVRYVDPDGEIIIPFIFAAIFVTGVVAVTITVAAMPLFKSLERAAEKELAKTRTSPNFENHHFFPIFMGGKEQGTVPMEPSQHQNFHRDLRIFLRENYPSMEPKSNNSGAAIQQDHSPAKRKEAMARFYLTHGNEYPTAAYSFFVNNPETYNDDNIQWAAENASNGLKRFVLRPFTEPTEE